MTSLPILFPPKEITNILRIESVGVLIAAIATYQWMGGNWWLFAVLLLVPDVAMIAAFGGSALGTRVYNAAHTYALPGILIGISLLAGWTQVPPLMMIWVAHIAMDRTLGYGLKYPGLFRHTHLGVMGKADRKAADLAHAR